MPIDIGALTVAGEHIEMGLVTQQGYLLEQGCLSKITNSRVGRLSESERLLERETTWGTKSNHYATPFLSALAFHDMTLFTSSQKTHQLYLKNSHLQSVSHQDLLDLQKEINHVYTSKWCEGAAKGPLGGAEVTAGSG